MNDQLDLLERIAVALEALAASRQHTENALGDRVVALKVERNGNHCLARNGEAIAESQITGRITSLTLSPTTHCKYGEMELLKLGMQGIDGRAYLLEMGGSCTAARCLTAGISRLTQLDDITVEVVGGNDKEAKSVLINLYQKGGQVRSSCRDWTQEIRSRAISVVERLGNASPAKASFFEHIIVNPPIDRATAQNRTAPVGRSAPNNSSKPKQPTTEIELIASVNKWVKALGWDAESWLKWMRSNYNTVLLADLSPEQLNQIRATLWKIYQQSASQDSAPVQNGAAVGR